MAERVAIFDTTLRDGEQSPGASMNAHEKIQMALQRERLGVDVIEAGFPIASQQEFESVQQIAATVQKPGVAAFARAVDKDIERAAAAPWKWPCRPRCTPLLRPPTSTSNTSCA